MTTFVSATCSAFPVSYRARSTASPRAVQTTWAAGLRRQRPSPTFRAALVQQDNKFNTHAFSRKSTTQISRNVLRPSASAAASGGEPSRSTNVLLGAKVGLEKRMEADPQFLYKLFVECGVDQLITVVANLSAFGLNPTQWTSTAMASAFLLHFTAILNDVVLVWYLAPLAGVAGKEAKISHMFQEVEGVTMMDRIMCWVDKFKLYGVVGSFTALVGGLLTSCITGMPMLPMKMAKTACLGFVHLGISANTRYQCVNGLEQLMSNVLPTSVAKLGTLVVRMSNNFLGARVFLLLASLF